MRHLTMIVAALVLFLAFGVNCSYAQQTDPGENAMMHDDAMAADAGMTTGDHQCGMMGKMEGMGEMSGMMGSGMGMAQGCCGGMKHGGMEHGGMMGGGMMGGGMMREGTMGSGMMGHMGMMMMPEDIMEARHHMMGMMMHLGINEKQKETAVQIIDGTAKDLIKKRSDLLIAKIELEDILHKDPVDMNAAASKMKQIEATKTDMFLAHLKAFEEIKSMLTPEQKSEFKEMMEERMMEERMMGGKGMEKGCGCGMMEEKKAHHGKKKMTK